MSQCGVELPSMELTLDLLVGFADLHQTERQPTGPAAKLLDIGLTLGLGDPFLVDRLDTRRQAIQLSPGQRRQTLVDGQCVVPDQPDQAELGRSGHRP